MKLTGLNIPDELKAFWALIVKSLAGVSDQSVQLNYPYATRQQRAALKNNSLMVLWQPLWDTFTSLRRQRWTTYWGSLPFGSHAGAGFFPGSGFSAFVYTNAPRYKAHLDLLLDPPNGIDLVLNGNFNGNANDWTLFTGAFYNGHKLTLPQSPFSNPAAGAFGHMVADQYFGLNTLLFQIHANGVGRLGLAGGSGSTFVTHDFNGDEVWSVDYELQLSPGTPEFIIRELGPTAGQNFGGDLLEVKALIFP